MAHFGLELVEYSRLVVDCLAHGLLQERFHLWREFRALAPFAFFFIVMINSLL